MEIHNERVYKSNNINILMIKKKVTLSVDSKTYSDFQKYCEENAIMLSKRIEIFINEFLNENRKIKTKNEVRK